MKDREIELAVAHPVLGGLAEELCRRLQVRLTSGALGVEHREVVHRLDIAAFGGAAIPILRLR
jgi:hypothetical protein